VLPSRVLFCDEANLVLALVLRVNSTEIPFDSILLLNVRKKLVSLRCIELSKHAIRE